MMKVTKTPDGFTLFLDDVAVLTHSLSNPSVTIGTGEMKITIKHGMYYIDEERMVWTRPMQSFTTEEKEGQLVISFDEGITLTITEEEKCIAIVPSLSDGVQANRFSITLALDPNQPVLGGGEQFSHLDLRGKVLPMWVSEPGVGRGPNYVRLFANVHSRRGGSQEHTYYPQPSYVAPDGRWALLESSAFSRLDFSKRGECSFSVHEIPSALRVGKTNSLDEAVGALSTIVGRQTPLPSWCGEGLILGVQGGKDRVMAQLGKLLSAKVKVAAVWCQDWQGIRMTPYGKQLFWNWQRDDSLYPDLPQWIEELHSMGIKFLGYNNPYLASDGPLYEEARQKGYLVLDEREEEPYTSYSTTFPFGLVDLCNPEAVTWFKQVIKEEMIDIGLDGWMADFGEYLPTDGKLHGSADPYIEHNRYPVRWAALNKEAIAEAGREGEILFFCRSGFSGSTAHATSFWAGDQLVNYMDDDGLPSVVVSAISSAHSAVGNWHFDIGGFFSFAWIKRSRDLLARSCELAAFTPMMRSHEGINPKVNAQLYDDPATIAHLKRMVDIHVALGFYHRHVQDQYQRAGRPPFKPLIIDSEVIEDQYFYGDDLLVAPVLQKNRARRKVVLPKGQWIHFFTHTPYGEGMQRVTAPIGEIPVFIRAESQFREELLSIMKEG